MKQPELHLSLCSTTQGKSKQYAKWFAERCWLISRGVAAGAGNLRQLWGEISAVGLAIARQHFVAALGKRPPRQA